MKIYFFLDFFRLFAYMPLSRGANNYVEKLVL